MMMRRRKVCRWCEHREDHIDYKDERVLRRFINERGKILSRRVSGNCARHQRMVTIAVKRGRMLAIVGFVNESYR